MVQVVVPVTWHLACKEEARRASLCGVEGCQGVMRDSNPTSYHVKWELVQLRLVLCCC